MAKLVDVRKSIHMLDTISFSVAGRPMSSVLTKVKGARGSSESASLPSGRSFVGLEVNSLCSVKRRILERKKNEFWMLGKIATTLVCCKSDSSLNPFPPYICESNPPSEMKKLVWNSMALGRNRDGPVRGEISTPNKMFRTRKSPVNRYVIERDPTLLEPTMRKPMISLHFNVGRRR